ncbi:MAG: hypothetical protein QF405_03585 [Roseibacillus sp.]|nr:hypothetical protein [Roseibacillus sp.]MDP7306699.1 hypothetical protein [Roseibacillus sp.]MDP7656815.1 hypothetical protein [Roseibacillus sp.]HJM62757.1 hypothetical protein [Roseibacillus sp.]
MTRLLPIVILMPFWASLSVRAQEGPSVTSPTKAPPNPYQYRKTVYPWRRNITATIFWIGEKPGGQNTTSNHHSSWDGEWAKNYGGYDDPDPKARENFAPRAFRPGLNPFYVALPYNDCLNHRRHRPEASRVIPWFSRYNPPPGESICKGRWIQLYYRGKVCYAQWEDCGPWVTDDWKYVFAGQPPRNNRAGIDVSPSVRDYLGLKSGEKLHWRFVEFGGIPRGPWSWYGSNNPFVDPEVDPDVAVVRRLYQYLEQKRLEEFRRKQTQPPR